MKSIIFLGFIGGVALGQERDPKIVEFELSETSVFQIPTSMGVTTTVVFPGEIGIVGGDLVTDPTKEQGEFTLATGPNHFSIAALSQTSKTNITVFCRGKAYSLELMSSTAPIYKAHFVEVGERTKVLDGKRREFDELNGEFLDDVGLKRKFSVNRIIGFLDKCRALPILATQTPNPVADILFTPKRKKYEVEGFTVEIKEAYRDNALDAVGFKLIFRSKDGKQHLYDPEAFGISAGEKYYRQITASADGVIPAIGAKEAFFVISGDGKGGRNELSLHTDFTLHMQRLDPKRYQEADRTGDGATLFKSPKSLGYVYDEDLAYSHLLPPLPGPVDLPILPPEVEGIPGELPPNDEIEVTPQK